MGNRKHYNDLADAERRAAIDATAIEAVRAHLQRAREYSWLAATEPYSDEAGTPPSSKRI